MKPIGRTANVLHRRVGTETVALVPGVDRAFALGDTASIVWDAIDRPMDRASLIDQTGLDGSTVDEAVSALTSVGLLTDSSRPVVSRRALLAGGAVAGGGLVAAIALPTVAAAASGPTTRSGSGGNASGGSNTGSSGTTGDPGQSSTSSAANTSAATNSQAANTGSLAVTGAPVEQEAALGAALMALGAGAVGLSRTRGVIGTSSGAIDEPVDEA